MNTNSEHKIFDNEDRNRYYGLRIGDIVDLFGIGGKIVFKNAEVVGYVVGDNNRVEVEITTSKKTDWVAEWCTIVTKVEDRNHDNEIIEKLAKNLSQGIDETDDIEALHNFGTLGLLTTKEITTVFYNDIKKAILIDKVKS